jgi:hypothetical protein
MVRASFIKRVREDYYGPFEFFREFPDEESCENEILRLKYPDGYTCKKCGCQSFYRLKGSTKIARKLQCRECKCQESLTANTLFHGTRTSLQKWFFLIFSMVQTKKGISANQLSKELHIDETTVLLMMTKVRKEMEESVVDYQIGGENCIVECDEIDIGGKNREKQKSLVLLERNSGNKNGRIRIIPIASKSYEDLEKVLIPLIKKGTILHTDGNPVYKKLHRKYKHYFDHRPIASWEENHTHQHLDNLNKVVGNLKRWYRGIHHAFRIKNTGYYLNEFCYRFNRRRSESNIFINILTRSVERPKILTYKKFSQNTPYSMLAA